MRRGQGLPGSPDGTLEAVAVKNMDYDYVGAAERYCLERVQRALRDQSGPHHIIELVEALPWQNTGGDMDIRLICK